MSGVVGDPRFPEGRVKVAKHAKITLTYPDHLLDPDHLVTFIEMNGFSDDWKKLGLSDEDLWSVQTMIGADPTGFSCDSREPAVLGK